MIALYRRLKTKREKRRKKKQTKEERLMKASHVWARKGNRKTEMKNNLKKQFYHIIDSNKYVGK